MRASEPERGWLGPAQDAGGATHSAEPPSVSLLSSLALLSLTAGIRGFLLEPSPGPGGSTVAGIASSQRTGHAGKSTRSAWLLGAASAYAAVGNSPHPRQPPLSLASSASWGYLQRWGPGRLCHPTQPGWLEMQLRAGAGCPLLITHTGAGSPEAAFIMGKALLAHSAPLAAPKNPVLGSQLRYLPSSREPHDLQPAYLKSNAGEGPWPLPKGKCHLPLPGEPVLLWKDGF